VPFFYFLGFFMDSFILALDRAVRTLSGATQAQRVNPAEIKRSAKNVSGVDNPRTAVHESDDAKLSDAERQTSIALMRVNHAGEVAAQALYQGQALFCRDPVIREQLVHAAEDELDHLAWTRERVTQLGGRTSLLDPVWYLGSFAIGAAAAAIGDKISLGFLKATEEQVEAHLDRHLDQLPLNDVASRKIVTAMKHDEAAHAQNAHDLGARELPGAAQKIMAFASKIMTTTAAKI
jgi:3-demethoxyubiquinol 3-hydroxylase